MNITENIILFNSKGLGTQEISDRLLLRAKIAFREMDDDSKEGKQHDLPGSWLLHFSQELEEGIKILLSYSYEIDGKPLMADANLAYILSLEFRNKPFVYISNPHAENIAFCVVYKNGQIADKVNPFSGDSWEYGIEILQKHLNIEDITYDRVKKWLKDFQEYNHYRVCHFSHLKYQSDRKYVFDWLEVVYKGTELIKQKPTISDMELIENLGLINRVKLIPLMRLYNKEREDLEAGLCKSELYCLTDGDLYSSEGLWLKEKAMKITPNELFGLYDSSVEQGKKILNI